MYPWFKFFNEYNNEKLEAPHPIKGLLMILEIAVFQIFILGNENISLKLLEFGKKLDMISFLFIGNLVIYFGSFSNALVFFED